MLNPCFMSETSKSTVDPASSGMDILSTTTEAPSRSNTMSSDVGAVSINS